MTSQEQKNKVLLIDDCGDMLEVISGLLEMRLNVEIVTASNPTDGVNAALDNPDLSLVICDYAMPDESGAWVCSRLKELDITVPFILYSSMGLGVVKEFRELNVTAMIEKTDFEYLQNITEEIITRK